MQKAIELFAYSRASREEPFVGIFKGERPEPSLDEARRELAKAMSRLANNFCDDTYGPLIVNINETVVIELLRRFEAYLSETKSSLTFIMEELLDRHLKSG